MNAPMRAAAAALLLFGLAAPGRSQTLGYTKDPATGKYSVTITFADGTVITLPGLSGTTPPVVTPPPGGGTETNPPPTTPPPANLPPLSIARVIPGDDSVVIKVVPFPGAADYVAFDSANPSDLKASGGNTLVEWNGPVKGVLLVRALSQLAPHQDHMIAMPGMMANEGASGMAAVVAGVHVANGHGPATNPITPIAESSPISPVYKPITGSAGASQVVIERWNPPTSVQRIGDNRTNLSFTTADGAWKGTAFNADFASTDPMFISHTHAMWNLIPGMTPGLGPALQQNGTVVWEWQKGVADITAGGVAHFSIECDSHFPQNRRRWWEIYAIPAGDTVLNPENLDVLNNGGTDFSKVKPTTSGNLLAWMIDGQFHQVVQVGWTGTSKTLDYVTHTSWGDPAGAGDRFGPCLRGTAEGNSQYNYAPGKTLNGDIRDLDLRHRFDIYLSKTRIRIEERDAEGVTVRVLDRALVKPLTFTRMTWVVAGKVYHPTNDGTEITDPGDRDYYWQAKGGGNGVSYGADMRHFDTARSEVLTDFPK